MIRGPTQKHCATKNVAEMTCSKLFQPTVGRMAADFDMVEWNKQFPASDAEAERMVQKQLKEEKHRITEFTVAGNNCLAAICVAMVSLVVIAFKNSSFKSA